MALPRNVASAITGKNHVSDFASFLSLPWLDFPGVLILIGSLTLPTIGVAYLFLRIRLRREDFLALFTDPAVGGPYLATRGQLIKRDANEAIEAYRSRVKAECTKFCLRQFKGEFGRLHWLLPLILAALLTWITITFLIQEAFGTPLKEETPLPIFFALLGGLLWSFYVVFRDYTQTDLSPTTFYWIAFRYVLAIALGSLASEVFATGFANVGAFVLAILPFEDTIRFIRSKIPDLEAEKVELKLTSLQGLTPDNAERLKELGVQTIQQLAYADPLRLLLGSNLSARVLIDWMDQA